MKPAFVALILVWSTADARQETSPAQMKCTGNEPFWSVEAGPDNALIDRLAAQREQAVYRGKLQRFGFLEPDWVVWRGQSIAESRDTLVLVARREACLDTMADGPPADYRAVVSFADGTAATGCCHARFAYDAGRAPVADTAGKPADDWSRMLPEVAPGVIACINDSGVAVNSVARAERARHDDVIVWLRSTAGSLHQCTVDRSTLKLRDVRVAAGDLHGQLDRPRFLPAREQPPLVNCGRLERVLDERGVLLGYLQYDSCD